MSTTPHVPVLLNEVLEALAPLDEARIVDGTFGAGGYSKALLSSGAKVIGFDRDPAAIAAGQALQVRYPDRFTLVESPFSKIDHALREHDLAPVDGLVLDIGVSSMQLDQAERGFSFRHDGPLDMRMSGEGLSAADIVNQWSETALADLFYRYGEERRSRAIARLICEVRQDWRIETTGALANLIEKLLPPRSRGQGPMIHPATRTFQALRIAVNDELNELVGALLAAERSLKPGGRLVVVTFHSLEDRIVKRFLAGPANAGSRHMPELGHKQGSFKVVTRRPVVPTDGELEANPRSRSAKLRAGVRISTPRGDELTDQQFVSFARELGVPQLIESGGRKVPAFRKVAGDQHARG